MDLIYIYIRVLIMVPDDLEHGLICVGVTRLWDPLSVPPLTTNVQNNAVLRIKYSSQVLQF